MNRFVLGTCLLVLSPFVAGCDNFYVLNPPAPAATPTPVPPTPDFPIDPSEGTSTTVTVTPDPKGIPLNTAPTKLRAVDIIYAPRDSKDPANCSAFLVIQTATPLASASASTSTSGGSAPVTLGAADTSNPIRLAGIIVPGPRGQASAGLQDADLLALQDLAYQGSIKALRSWTQVPLSELGPVPTPASPRATPRAQAISRTAPTPIPAAFGARDLDVYQDPRYPIDSDNRRLAQAFFTSVDGIKTKPTGSSGPATQVLVKPDTPLSLNRMMIRSGWAVVDLYSSTSFDQPTWLLDEAYARHRNLGMWGLQLNGKKFTLQQRPPATPATTGSKSSVSVIPSIPGATPVGTPSPNATQATKPNAAPQPFPSVIPHSGTSVNRGPLTASKLPPASQGQSTAPVAATTPAGGPSPGSP